MISDFSAVGSADFESRKEDDKSEFDRAMLASSCVSEVVVPVEYIQSKQCSTFSACEREADCEGQREESLQDSDIAPLMEETSQSKLTSLENVTAVVQSQALTDYDREGSSVQPFGALTPKLKSSVLASVRDEAPSIASRSEGKRFRGKRGKAKSKETSSVKHAKAAIQCRDIVYRDAKPNGM